MVNFYARRVNIGLEVIGGEDAAKIVEKLHPHLEEGSNKAVDALNKANASKIPLNSYTHKVDGVGSIEFNNKKKKVIYRDTNNNVIHEMSHEDAKKKLDELRNKDGKGDDNTEEKKDEEKGFFDKVGQAAKDHPWTAAATAAGGVAAVGGAGYMLGKEEFDPTAEVFGAESLDDVVLEDDVPSQEATIEGKQVVGKGTAKRWSVFYRVEKEVDIVQAKLKSSNELIQHILDSRVHEGVGTEKDFKRLLEIVRKLEKNASKYKMDVAKLEEEFKKAAEKAPFERLVVRLEGEVKAIAQQTQQVGNEVTKSAEEIAKELPEEESKGLWATIKRHKGKMALGAIALGVGGYALYRHMKNKQQENVEDFGDDGFGGEGMYDGYDPSYEVFGMESAATDEGREIAKNLGLTKGKLGHVIDKGGNQKIVDHEGHVYHLADNAKNGRGTSRTRKAEIVNDYDDGHLHIKDKNGNRFLFKLDKNKHKSSLRDTKSDKEDKSDWGEIAKLAGTGVGGAAVGGVGTYIATKHSEEDFDPSYEVFGDDTYTSFADRFPNRNFVSMEDLDEIGMEGVRLIAGKGNLIIRTSSELKQVVEKGEPLSLRTFKLYKNGREYRWGKVPLTHEQVQMLLEENKDKSNLVISNSFLKRVFKKDSQKVKHDLSSSSKDSDNWSTGTKVALGTGAAGAGGIGLYGYSHSHRHRKHR